MAYLLNADIMIRAKNLHYGFDFCQAFGPKVEDKIQETLETKLSASAGARGSAPTASAWTRPPSATRLKHLQGLMGANVEVRIDISAEVPEGVPEEIVRIVSEKANSLRFDQSGFEEE